MEVYIFSLKRRPSPISFFSALRCFPGPVSACNQRPYCEVVGGGVYPYFNVDTLRFTSARIEIPHETLKCLKPTPPPPSVWKDKSLFCAQYFGQPTSIPSQMINSTYVSNAGGINRSAFFRLGVFRFSDASSWLDVAPQVLVFYDWGAEFTGGSAVDIEQALPAIYCFCRIFLGCQRR